MTEDELPAALRALVRRTPLVDSPLGCALKLESLQVTGSFKVRGASFALHRLHVTGGNLDSAILDRALANR